MHAHAPPPTPLLQRSLLYAFVRFILIIRNSARRRRVERSIASPPPVHRLHRRIACSRLSAQHCVRGERPGLLVAQDAAACVTTATRMALVLIATTLLSTETAVGAVPHTPPPHLKYLCVTPRRRHPATPALGPSLGSACQAQLQACLPAFLHSISQAPSRADG